jgi:uncharacterized membrane protein HdeD (DUF308 family)
MPDIDDRGLSPQDRDLLRMIGRSWGWVLFFGIVTVALGAIVVIEPRATIYAFGIVVGIWLLVAGAFRIVGAIADHEDTSGARWLMAIFGILSIIVGVLFLRRTEETLATLGFLIGLFWLVGGLIEFFTAYSDHGSPTRTLRVVMGILGVAAGIVTLVWPGITLTVLAVIIGLWLVLYGLLELVLAFQLRRLARD